MDFVSPIIAISVFAFSIFIHFNTKRLIKHFQRPLVDFDNSSATINEGNYGNENKFEIKYNILFKNRGEHPAKNLEMKCFNESIKLLTYFESPNRLNSTSEMTVSGKIYTKEKPTREIPLYIILELRYEDYIQPKNKFKERFWYKYIGRDTIDHTTIKEKELIEKTFKKLY